MRECDHDCVQPCDDFIYTYPDIEDSPAEDPDNDNRKTVERTGKEKTAGWTASEAENWFDVARSGEAVRQSRIRDRL